MNAKQLLGEYECKIDAKGRMRMPSGLIAQLGDADALSFVINRGFEQCLMIYPEAVWDRITNEINQLNLYNKKNRAFVRYFYRGAQKVTMDSADRILVSKRLLEYAGIEREVVLSAYHDRIEIWAADQYEALLDEEPEDFSDLAEDVLGKANGKDEA
ncbi:MAG: division/cell wall cluster transcriptional repressor MraZ [Bacteroidetes bacterium]|nr:division/cell wall cluster transcriptional repressor MraZ [Bacteroidota bacterium]